MRLASKVLEQVFFSFIYELHTSFSSSGLMKNISSRTRVWFGHEACGEQSCVRRNQRKL